MPGTIHLAADLPRRRLRRAAWWTAGVFLLGVTPLVLFSAYNVNRYEQVALLGEGAASVLREVASDVGRIDTVMTSLTSMHHAMQDDEEAMVSLAAQLRYQTPWIRAIGRYRQLAPQERAAFTDEMADQGLYDFRIVDLGEKARTAEARLRDPAFPIAMLDPMTPQNLRLLGADLAGIAGLPLALTQAAADNRSHLIALPSNWPAGGQLMVFRPSYRGMILPRTAEARTDQSDGGYWLILDPVQLLAAAQVRRDVFDVSLEVVSEGSLPGERSHRIAEERATDHVMPWLYRPHRVEQSWSFGDARLIVRTVAHYGVARRATVMVSLLLLLSGALLLLGLAALRLRYRRLEDQLQSRATLFAERERAQRTLDALHDAVFTVDAQARLRSVNPAGALLIGRPGETPEGVPFDTLLSLQHADQPLDGHDFELSEQIASLPVTGERRLALTSLDASGAEAGWQASLSRIDGTREGEPGDVIVILRDNSSERRFTRELEHQATHDSLTGCTNRHFFEQELERRQLACRTPEKHYALLYMDLDQFKLVNDTAGHTAGDRLLIELTGNLHAVIRDCDLLCRLGGDEFGLIIVDVDRTEAREIADRVYTLFQSLVFTHESHVFAVRASLGLVHCAETGGESGDILTAADIACYAAKENGRNELFEYRAEDETMAMRSSELNWLPRLQGAMDRDEFTLHAQPVFELPSGETPGRIGHYEFLLRLADEEGRQITPWQIIQAAERYGLMRDLDRWIIRHAFSCISALSTGQCSAPAHGAIGTGLFQACNVGFSINLSGQSAADPTLIEFIREQFEEHRIDPGRIWFEITETAAISHFATAVDLANGIQALGSFVALDDFGAGLSSFGYLKNLPVDVLKIDGQFVRDLARNPIDREMVRAIAQIAKAMDIRTVAEFVEDAETMQALMDIGVDYAQGYHIARPMPVAEAIQLLEGQGAEFDTGNRQAA